MTVNEKNQSRESRVRVLFWQPGHLSNVSVGKSADLTMLSTALMPSLRSTASRILNAPSAVFSLPALLPSAERIPHPPSVESHSSPPGRGVGIFPVAPCNQKLVSAWGNQGLVYICHSPLHIAETSRFPPPGVPVGYLSQGVTANQ